LLHREPLGTPAAKEADPEKNLKDVIPTRVGASSPAEK